MARCHKLNNKTSFKKKKHLITFIRVNFFVAIFITAKDNNSSWPCLVFLAISHASDRNVPSIQLLVFFQCCPLLLVEFHSGNARLLISLFSPFKAKGWGAAWHHMRSAEIPAYISTLLWAYTTAHIYQFLVLVSNKHKPKVSKWTVTARRKQLLPSL